MKNTTNRIAVLTLTVTSLCFSAAPIVSAALPQTQQPAASRPIGTIKAITGNTVTLTTDSGAEIAVTVQDSARILRIEPGQKDLTNATVMHLQDLQVGDRILVRGQPSDDGKSILASTVIAMKKASIAQKQEQEQQDWRGGVGGLVKSVDTQSGTVTLAVETLAGVKNVTVQTAKDTIVRRYAPDSVKFSDAKLSTLEQIRPGDQLWARGARSSDGNDLTAQEIVSGAFRNIAGTITSIDAARNTLTVMDFIAKKPVLVKITAESELRQLTPQMAQFIAMRLRATQGGQPGTAADAEGSRPAGARPQGRRRTNSEGGNPRAANRTDFQQILNRLAPAKLAGLQKGEAVMIVSTEGAVSQEVTAITLLGGVEPILAAAPQGGQAMTLSPWSLSAPAGDTGNP